MSEYTLSNSAAVIDAAISSVAGADATPTAGSQNMVTSSGVKTYVDGAVVDYVSAQTIVAVCKAADGSLNLIANTPLNFSIAYQHNNSVSISGSDVVLAEGKYLVQFSGNFNEDDNDVLDFAKIRLLKNNSEVFSTVFDETGANQNQAANFIGINHFEVTSGGSSTWSVQIQPTSRPVVRWKSVTLIFTKLL